MEKAKVFVPAARPPEVFLGTLETLANMAVKLLEEIHGKETFKTEAELKKVAPAVHRAIQSVGGISSIGADLIGFAIPKAKTETVQEATESEVPSPWAAINRAAENKQDFTIDAIFFREETTKVRGGENHHPTFYRVPVHFSWVEIEGEEGRWEAVDDWAKATTLLRLTYSVPKEYLPKEEEITPEKLREEFGVEEHTGVVDEEEEEIREEQSLYKVLLNKVAELLEKVRATLRSSG